MRILFAVPLLTVLSAFGQQGAAVPSAPQYQSQSTPPQLCGLKDLTLQAKLLSSLTTERAKPGDSFTAQVLSPEAWAGGIVEGSVRSLVKAERGFGKGKPNIELEFTALTFSNRTCSISGSLQEVTNSKGVAKVDEEGRAVGHTSNKKRVGATLGGILIGATVGAMTAGGTGAVTGGAAGGVAAFLITSKLTTTGADIAFLPGSVFTISASDSHQKNKGQ